MNSTEKINISSMLKQKKGVHYLEENHINYFKNAENVYKGGILKSLSSMARLIYGEYESDTIAPVIAIDLERHLYSQYSFLYEIGGLINHIVAAIQLIKIREVLISIHRTIIVHLVLDVFKLKFLIKILPFKIKVFHFGMGYSIKKS